MKTINIFAITLIVLTFQSIAVSKTRTQSPYSAGEISNYFAPSRSDANVRIPLALGMPYFRNRTGISLHAGVDFKVSSDLPLFLGFETGVDILGTRYYYTDTFRAYENDATIALPLLLSAVYRFELPKVPTLHPYAGIAAGTYIIFSNGSEVVAEVMLRPGVSWGFANGMELHGEPRFGVIGGVFTVQPTFGITFLM